MLFLYLKLPKQNHVTPSNLEVIFVAAQKASPRTLPMDLEKRHRCRIYIVNIVVLAFNAIPAGAKQPIPDPCLLAIVVTVFPSGTMVQVVIFKGKLEVECP